MDRSNGSPWCSRLRSRGITVLGVAAGLILALPALAVTKDLTGNAAASFMNHIGYDGDKATLKFTKQSAMGILAAAGCPTTSSVEIMSDGQVARFALDCNGWSARGAAWKYKATGRKSGAIRGIKLGNDTVMIKAKGHDYGLDAIAGPAAWVEVRLNIGDTTYCGRLAPPRATASINSGEKMAWRGTSTRCSGEWPTPTAEATPTATPGGSTAYPRVRLDSPLHGSFTAPGSVAVSGRIIDAVPGMVVRVNGIPVAISGNQFTTNVSLSGDSVVNAIVAEVEAAGAVARDRVDVMVGQYLEPQAVNPAGYDFQMGAPLLDRLEPLIAQQVESKFDGINFVPPGTGFHVGGPPEVTFGISSGITAGGFTFDASPSAGSLHTALVIPGIHFNLTVGVRIPMPYPIPDISAGCNNIGLEVGRTVFAGEFQIQPGAPLSVEEVGFDLNLGSLSTGGATCGGVPLDPLLFGFTPILTNLLSDLLRNPASLTNAPVRNALQDALSPFAAVPFIGSSLAGVLAQVDELSAGISMLWNASIQDPGSLPLTAPRLVGSFLPALTPASLGSLTPHGQPYAAAIAVTTSALNQLLQAGIERGGLAQQWGQIPVGTLGPLGLTPALLDLLVPGLNLSERLGAGTPLALRLTPAHPFQTWTDGKPRGVAPLLSGNTGPHGAMSELLLPYLSFDVVDPNSGEILLQGVFQGRVGVNFQLHVDPQTGAASLGVTVTDIDWSDIALLFLDDPSGLEAAAIEYLLPIVLEQIEPYVQDALGNLPIPQLAGYDLSQIELDQLDGSVVLFVNVN